METIQSFRSVSLHGFCLLVFIYFEIQHATIQQQNYKIHNTAYAYMDTKGQVSRHIHSTRKKEIGPKIHTSG